MRVLIVAEDPSLDQHVLKPVVERIFQDLQRPVRVDVLKDPHISGAAQALNTEILADIVDDNQMIDLFLLMVDRDCDRMNHEAKVAARRSEHPTRLIGVLAHQEVEVWALALHREALGVPWKEVREHCDPKEEYFEPFVVRAGWLDTVGRGRKRAMRDLGQSWRGLLQMCPEIEELKEGISQWLMERGQ